MSQMISETTKTPSEADQVRAAWMKTLADSDPAHLKKLWSSQPELSGLTFEVFRRPERGLVMVRARAGSAGERFNLGEMTVTRCAVRLPDGTTGLSYISGRDTEHALIAAKVDALLQTDSHGASVQQAVIDPLTTTRQQELKDRAEKISATKVNFFTMVRNREDKK